jgi:hypothetical protein
MPTTKNYWRSRCNSDCRSAFERCGVALLWSVSVSEGLGREGKAEVRCNSVKCASFPSIICVIITAGHRYDRGTLIFVRLSPGRVRRARQRNSQKPKF